MTTRREFMRVSAAAGAALAMGGGVKAALGTASGGRGAAGLRILILGGTGFIGPATVEAAQARGHTLTLFNRGRTEKRRGGMFPDMDKRYGNRDPNKHADDADPSSPKGLESLSEGEWDVVIDNSGFYPRMVRASAELLSKRARQYIFISSISAYKDTSKLDQDETAALATMEDPNVESMGEGFKNYGPLKVLCEQAAEAAFPGRATIVRPGYIVGPTDPTDRFTYWPVRFDRARGDQQEVLVPGSPDDPIQIIDARDLGAWLVLLAENKTFGAFNACGPETRLTMGGVVEACKGATDATPKLTWVSPEFLEKKEKELQEKNKGQANQEGINLPIWAPFKGETAGFHTWKNDRAIKAGLRFRPVGQITKDTLEWFKKQPAERQAAMRAGLKPQMEKELLEAWHKEHA